MFAAHIRGSHRVGSPGIKSVPCPGKDSPRASSQLAQTGQCRQPSPGEVGPGTGTLWGHRLCSFSPLGALESVSFSQMDLHLNPGSIPTSIAQSSVTLGKSFNKSLPWFPSRIHKVKRILVPLLQLHSAIHSLKRPLLGSYCVPETTPENRREGERVFTKCTGFLGELDTSQAENCGKGSRMMW